MPHARHCLRAVTEQTLFSLKYAKTTITAIIWGKIHETRAVEGHERVVGVEQA